MDANGALRAVELNTCEFEVSDGVTVALYIHLISFLCRRRQTKREVEMRDRVGQTDRQTDRQQRGRKNITTGNEIKGVDMVIKYVGNIITVSCDKKAKLLLALVVFISVDVIFSIPSFEKDDNLNHTVNTKTN